jgi:hypothetical protein
MMKREPTLRTVIGSDLRGHIRRNGVLFRVHESAKAGDLPFEAEMVPMPRGSWHWLELRSGSYKAHICRSEGPEKFPEDTPTRQDERLENQFDFFKLLRPEVVVDLPPKVWAAWLTYNVFPDGTLGHLCWGMPSAHTDVWLARINVLRRLAESSAESAPEAPSKGLGLRFRDFVEDALSKERDETRG